MKAVLLSIAILLPSVAAAQAPAGWKTQRDGDEIAMTPPRLQAGELFYLVVQPGKDAGGKPLGEWLEGEIGRLGKRIGKQIRDDGTHRLPDGTLIVGRTFRNKKGTVVFASFTASVRPSGKVALMSLLCAPEKVCNAHRPAVEKMLSGLSGERPAPGAAEPGRRDAQRAAGRDARRVPEREPYQTEPGRGIEPSAIEAVMAESYSTSVAGGMDLEASRPVLLLKNGDYCRRLDVAPADMDVARHKQAHPGWWGRWRRAGGKYEVLEDGAWKASGWRLRLEPARPGQQLRGNFATAFSTGTAGTAVSSTSSLSFLPGGRFRRGQRVYTTTSNVSAGSTERNGGTYRLDGRTLELRHGDGHVERRAFHWLDAVKQDAFYLNGALYLRAEK